MAIGFAVCGAAFGVAEAAACGLGLTGLAGAFVVVVVVVVVVIVLAAGMDFAGPVVFFAGAAGFSGVVVFAAISNGEMKACWRFTNAAAVMATAGTPAVTAARAAEGERDMVCVGVRRSGLTTICRS